MIDLRINWNTDSNSAGGWWNGCPEGSHVWHLSGAWEGQESKPFLRSNHHSSPSWGSLVRVWFGKGDCLGSLLYRFGLSLFAHFQCLCHSSPIATKRWKIGRKLSAKSCSKTSVHYKWPNVLSGNLRFRSLTLLQYIKTSVHSHVHQVLSVQHEGANWYREKNCWSMFWRSLKCNHSISNIKWFWNFPNVACEITHLGNSHLGNT